MVHLCIPPCVCIILSRKKANNFKFVIPIKYDSKSLL